MQVSNLLFSQETYAPAILKRRVDRLRKETGNGKVYTSLSLTRLWEDFSGFGRSDLSNCSLLSQSYSSSTSIWLIFLIVSTSSLTHYLPSGKTYTVRASGLAWTRICNKSTVQCLGRMALSRRLKQKPTESGSPKSVCQVCSLARPCFRLVCFGMARERGQKRTG